MKGIIGFLEIIFEFLEKIIESFLALPFGWQVTIVASVIIAAWYISAFYLLKRSITSDLKDIIITGEKEITMESYEWVPSEIDVFQSPVDEKLRVKIVQHKNKDIKTFSTSRPHLFNRDDLAPLKDQILEIVSVKATSHEVIINKSAAARWDSNNEILKKIFLQLHTMYAQQKFYQCITVAAYKEKKDTVSLQFASNMKDLTTIILELSDHLELWPSIKSVRKDDCLTLLLTKGDVSWSQFKSDVTLALKEYFSAGIDIEGQWPEDKPTNAREVRVQVFLDKPAKVFEFPAGLFQGPQSINILLEASEEIESFHFTEVFSPRKTVLEIKPCQAHSPENLCNDIHSVFAIFDPEHEYLFFCGDSPY